MTPRSSLSVMALRPLIRPEDTLMAYAVVEADRTRDLHVHRGHLWLSPDELRRFEPRRPRRVCLAPHVQLFVYERNNDAIHCHVITPLLTLWHLDPLAGEVSATPWPDISWPILEISGIDMKTLRLAKDWLPLPAREEPTTVAIR